MAAPLPLEDAQQRLLSQVEPLGLERVPVAEALGRYLAEPLIARRTQPSGDVSAMDGYAMRAADLPGPWRVIGESAAGHPFAGDVQPGTAVRISTGALMPAGADMVLLQEDAALDDAALRLDGTPPDPVHRHIRRCGNDFAAGTQLLAVGTRLGAAQAALVFAAGQHLVPVRRPVRLAVIDSGDELAADPAACAPHQVPASNGAMLAAMAAHLAQDVQRIGPVPDDLSALVSALDAASSADVIVTSGGASVGDHDLIRPALERWGATLDFWRVAIKPGKPLLVARRNRQLILGLPGNPVSSHVTAYLFLLPLLRALLGAASPVPRPVMVPTAELLRPGGDRREFLRGWWDGSAVTARVNQDSGALAALAHSNVLIDRPAHSPAIEPGTPVPVYLLENGGIA